MRFIAHIAVPLVFTTFLAAKAQATLPECLPDYSGRPLIIHEISKGKRVFLCGDAGETQAMPDRFRLSGLAIIVEGLGDKRKTVFQASENDDYFAYKDPKLGIVLERQLVIPSGVRANRSYSFYKFGFECTEEGCTLGKKSCSINWPRSLFPTALQHFRKLEKGEILEGQGKPSLPDDGTPLKLVVRAISGDAKALRAFNSIERHFSLDGAAAEDFDQAKDVLEKAREADCLK